VQREEVVPAHEIAGHRILFANLHGPGPGVDDRNDPDVHRAHGRRVVVHEPDDPRFEVLGKDEFLAQLPAKRLVDDVGPVLGVHVPADADRELSVQPALPAAVGPLTEEEHALPRDERVGDHLLQRRILLDAIPVGEEPARVDAPEELRPRAEEAVRRALGEELRARHDVDLFAHRDVSGSCAT